MKQGVAEAETEPFLLRLNPFHWEFKSSSQHYHPCMGDPRITCIEPRFEFPSSGFSERGERSGAGLAR